MMSPQHLSMNMNSSMNSLPITRQRLMKAKTFKQQEQQDQQQDQQQQQPMILPLSSFTMATAVPVPVPTPAPIPVFVVTTNMRRRTTKNKSVRFNNCVRVAPFEKVTSTEAKDVWLNSMELASIKSEGREMASSYRKLLLETQQHRSQESSLSNYRGFENVTILRKRQKIVANRSAIYAHLQGYKTEEIAFIYQQSTTFSMEIAFLQAIHDYAEIYTTNTTSANDITTALQQQLPSVASCLPPTPLPFAIESAIFFQRQKREQRNKNQKRTRASSSSSSSRSRSRSPPLSPPTSPSISPLISPSPSFEQQQYCQQQQQQQRQQQQQQATTVTRRIRQRV
mmetsp:Transcript_40060/g.46087  ORF Transcript_40060/g.46087 Transcript_40060/m.46087 type:complete len:339 (-) Transcript_40060:62-1078(-)